MKEKKHENSTNKYALNSKIYKASLFVAIIIVLVVVLFQVFYCNKTSKIDLYNYNNTSYTVPSQLVTKIDAFSQVENEHKSDFSKNGKWVVDNKNFENEIRIVQESDVRDHYAKFTICAAPGAKIVSNACSVTLHFNDKVDLSELFDEDRNNLGEYITPPDESDILCNMHELLLPSIDPYSPLDPSFLYVALCDDENLQMEIHYDVPSDDEGYAFVRIKKDQSTLENDIIFKEGTYADLFFTFETDGEIALNLAQK